MINSCTIKFASNERFCDKSVHESAVLYTINGKVNCKVTVVDER